MSDGTLKPAGSPLGWVVLHSRDHPSGPYAWGPMGETEFQGDVVLMRRSWFTVYPTMDEAEAAVRHIGDVESKHGMDWTEGAIFRVCALSNVGHELRPEPIQRRGGH